MTSQKTTWLGPIGNHKRQVKSATLGRSFWRHEREIRDHFMKSLEKVEKKIPSGSENAVGANWTRNRPFCQIGKNSIRTFILAPISPQPESRVK